MLTIATLLGRQAQRHGDVIALIDDETDRAWTVGDLARDSAVIADRLHAGGVRPGERVGMLSVNHPSMVLAYLAVARLGAVLVPFNWRLTVPEVSAIATDSGIGALVADRNLADTALEVAAEVAVGPEALFWIGEGPAPAGGVDLEHLLASHDGPAPELPAGGPAPDDLLYLMYTSGTTGQPKGAMHTHATTMAATDGALQAMDYRPGDRYLNVLPLFHVASLAMVNICLQRRCTMVLGRAFDPSRIWRTVADRSINAMMAVPAMLHAMADAHDPDLDTSSLRLLSSGAAPVPEPLLHRFHELGVDIVQAYGLTETGGAVSVLDPANAVSHLGSAGKVILPLDFAILDDVGTPVDAGTPGEIVVKGPSVTIGYWQPGAEAGRGLRNGWFHTGDVGVVDVDGFLTIKDRLKDMIISGGENVYPAEIESALLAHPDVVEIAVVGTPDDRWGEVPCAVVVAGDGFDVDEFTSWARQRLAGFKVPKQVHTVPALPRNASGKVLKQQVRAEVAG